jgi:hypothetical protein
MTSTSSQLGTDREHALRVLQRSLDAYLNTITSVPERAAGLRLNDQGWSILEIAEHVSVAEHGMYRALEMAVEKTTPPDYALDHKILAGLRDREAKREAPEGSRPKGRWKSIPECIEAFKQSRARSIELVKTAEDLRRKSVRHPLLGELDGHQVLLVMATHAERHAAQIEEIKASPAYLAAVRE